MDKILAKPWFYKSAPVIIWFLLLILPFLSSPGNIPIEAHHRFLINIFISNSLLLAIFYIHTYWIYPRFKDMGAIWYVLILTALFAGYWLYWYFFWRTPHGPPPFMDQRAGKPGFQQQRGFQPRDGGPHSFMPVLSPFIALLCSYCYRVILDNALREQLIKERETIHLRTELNFLRSQISPHFMFNTLNNLVSLSRKKSDLLEPAIINLSQIMRYMLYESDDNRVPLSKELTYLKSYVDLQLLRFGNKVKVTLNITGNTELMTIEPMLLIPFVENAFKHGTGMLESPLIMIALNINETGDTLEFRVVNSVNEADESKDKSSGIGLVNVQRRLAILYPDKHSLRIFNRNNSFMVELTLHTA